MTTDTKPAEGSELQLRVPTLVLTPASSAASGTTPRRTHRSKTHSHSSSSSSSSGAQEEKKKKKKVHSARHGAGCLLPLGHGWYEGVDAHDRKYYVHRERHVSQWAFPSELLVCISTSLQSSHTLLCARHCLSFLFTAA